LIAHDTCLLTDPRHEGRLRPKTHLCGGIQSGKTLRMLENPFEACWHRVDRVNEHRLALGEIWNEFIDRHPFDFGLFHEGDGVHVLEVWQAEPMPAEFALVFGEWLYNARACLDYIVWATSAYVTGQLPPPNDRVLQYPIYETQKDWEKNAYRLRGLADHHREMLHSMQPFNSDLDANYLGVINRLARTDRHRRFTISTATLGELQPQVAVPAGCRADLEWGQRVLVNGRAKVARITVSPWEDGAEVSVNPGIGIDPEVAEWHESVFWRRMPFSKRLVVMQTFLAAEVAIYEYDCTGESRKVDALTPEYREQCHRRGALGPIRLPSADEVTWSPAPPPTRPGTTRDW
jgi:hypothetical protein